MANGNGKKKSSPKATLDVSGQSKHIMTGPPAAIRAAAKHLDQSGNFVVGRSGNRWTVKGSRDAYAATYYGETGKGPKYQGKVTKKQYDTAMQGDQNKPKKNP